MDLIELRDIYKTYNLGEVDVPVLRGVSLNARQGELVALMGASGSGKSTLMNILGCLDHPTSGEYCLEGREVSGLTAKEQARLRNRMIGFVFQNFNLLPRTTARKSAWEIVLTTSRLNFQAVNNSAWPLPDRWSTSRGCFSPTSRPATLVHAPVRKSSRCSSSSTAPRGLPSSSSPMIPTWQSTLSRIIRIKDGLIEGDTSQPKPSDGA